MTTASQHLTMLVGITRRGSLGDKRRMMVSKSEKFSIHTLNPRSVSSSIHKASPRSTVPLCQFLVIFYHKIVQCWIHHHIYCYWYCWLLHSSGILLGILFRFAEVKSPGSNPLHQQTDNSIQQEQSSTPTIPLFTHTLTIWFLCIQTLIHTSNKSLYVSSSLMLFHSSVNRRERWWWWWWFGSSDNTYSRPSRWRLWSSWISGKWSSILITPLFSCLICYSSSLI